MTIQRVTGPDGRQYDIDLDDTEWETGAVGQASAPTGDRSDAAWGEMRRKAQAADTATRELAFVRAGLDPKADPRIEDFFKAWDGEADPEKVRQAAINRGYLEKPPDPGAETPRTPEQQAALSADQRISAAADGAIPTELPGEQQLAEALAQGGEQAMIAKARELGIPIVKDGDVPRRTDDPVGWGA